MTRLFFFFVFSPILHFCSMRKKKIRKFLRFLKNLYIHDSEAKNHLCRKNKNAKKERLKYMTIYIGVSPLFGLEVISNE